MEETDLNEKVKNEVERIISCIVEDELQVENVDILGKLIDIHKDLENEIYWKEKEDMMRYRDNGNYGTYGRRSRDSRGRYTESNHYGTDGERAIEEMQEHYGRYYEGKGRYGNGGQTMKSLEQMLESVVDFIDMLKRDATSQEEIDMIQRYSREICEM